MATPAEDEDDETSSAGGTTPNGFSSSRTEPRSVSATLHDRPRGSNATASSANGVNIPTSTASTPPTHHHHSHKHRSSSHGAGAINAASPQTARDSFLTYFFGGDKQSQGSGSTSAAPAALFASRAGRDSVGRDFAPSQDGANNEPSGLNSSRNTDASSAAFDMKSLGKHIEAVSNPTCSFLKVVH